MPCFSGDMVQIQWLLEPRPAEQAQRRVLRRRADAAQAKYLGGQGVARQRQAIINGLRDSIKNFSSDVDDVNSKDVIEMMMLTQYFDMLRDVGARCANDSMRLPKPDGAWCACVQL